jgi:hypothetical protein
MTSTSLSILLLTSRIHGAASIREIREILAERGLACSIAITPEEALDMFGHGKFDLILTLNTKLKEAPEPLLYSLGTSTVSAFLCYPAEAGCWWLPVLLNGKRCFGAPGLRERDFLEMIDSLSSPAKTTKSAAAGVA